MNMLDALMYLGSVSVSVGAMIRAARVNGIQWWAYVLYSVNSFVVIYYGYKTHQPQLIINQVVLMCTNCVGLVRWFGQ